MWHSVLFVGLPHLCRWKTALQEVILEKGQSGNSPKPSLTCSLEGLTLLKTHLRFMVEAAAQLSVTFSWRLITPSWADTAFYMIQGPRFRFCLQISTPVTISVRPNSYCQVSEEWEGARLASQPPESPLEGGWGGGGLLLCSSVCSECFLTTWGWQSCVPGMNHPRQGSSWESDIRARRWQRKTWEIALSSKHSLWLQSRACGLHWLWESRQVCPDLFLFRPWDSRKSLQGRE